MGSIINPLKTHKPKPLKTKSLINPRKTYKAYNKKRASKPFFCYLMFCFLMFLFSYFSLFVFLFFSFYNKIKISHKSCLDSRSSASIGRTAARTLRTSTRALGSTSVKSFCA